MLRILMLVVMLNVLTMLVMGCGSDSTSTHSMPDYTDATLPITTQRGQSFSISLASNPTTGHSWQFVLPSGAPLTQTDHTFVPVTTGTVGAGGTDVWTFHANKAGQTQITFNYLAPGTGQIVDTKVFTVTVMP